MRHSGGTITRFNRSCPIKPRKKTTRQVDQQRAVGKCTAHLDLHQPLQTISCPACQPPQTPQSEINAMCLRSGRACRTEEKTPGAAGQPGVISPGASRPGGYGELHRREIVPQSILRPESRATSSTGCSIALQDAGRMLLPRPNPFHAQARQLVGPCPTARMLGLIHAVLPRFLRRAPRPTKKGQRRETTL